MNEKTQSESDEARPETVHGRSRYPLLSDVGEFVTKYIDLDSDEDNNCIFVGMQVDRLIDGTKYNKVYHYNDINYVIYSVSINNFCEQTIELKRIKFANF